MNNSITISDVIKILPLPEKTKEKLLLISFGTDKAISYETQKILWDQYEEYKTNLTNLKYQRLMKEVEEGKRKISPHIYQDAEDEVLQDFENILTGKKKEQEQIEEIQAKLKSFSNLTTQ